MKRLLSLFLLIFSLLLTSSLTFSQTPKLEGTWEFMKPQLPQGIPFFTILKIIDKNGAYNQIRVTDKGSFIWQTAKLNALDDKNAEEIIIYCINPSMMNKTHRIMYSISEDENKNQILMIQGGTKVIDGVETFEWKEFWRKVEPIKQPTPKL